MQGDLKAIVNISDGPGGLVLKSLFKIPKILIPKNLISYITSVNPSFSIYDPDSEAQFIKLDSKLESATLDIEMSINLKSFQTKSKIQCSLFINYIEYKIITITLNTSNIYKLLEKQNPISEYIEPISNLPFLNIDLKSVETNDYITTFNFDIFSESITNLIQFKTGHVLNLLGQTNAIKHIDLDIKVDRLPKVCLFAGKNKSQLLEIANLCLSLKNQYPVIYDEKLCKPKPLNPAKLYLEVGFES